MSWRRRVRGRQPAFLGLVVGALLLAASMTPSLLPRHWAFQAGVSGIVAAGGYGLGTLASHAWRQLGIREPRPLSKRLAWRVLAVVGPVGVGLETARGSGWQQELHERVGLEVPPWWAALAALAVGLALAGLLILLARVIRLAARRVGGWLSRRLPARMSGVLGGILVAALVVGMLDGIVIDGLFSAADETFRVSDEVLEEDAEPPTDPLRSGGPGSLVTFDELGRQGRAFATGGPSTPQLERFADAPVTEPIRVYAGLDAARGDRARARLVVDELERTGAFDRAVLAVMTATGTGWIDPVAAAALEYLWAGDTALAAAQYSYLPSWLSFLADSGRARAAGSALFNTVHERWSELPLDDRPLLLVFGESLGADGSEAAFSSVADIENRTDGVLWVGPPNFSELWRSFTRRRDPGSPEILPVYDRGATVRFAARPDHLDRPDAPWPRPRVVYLQHASDPVVWWSPRLILRRPDWLVEPRGDDVLSAVRWYPLVTFLQVTADLINSQRVPAGHGHDYSALVGGAWAAIAPPEGWTAADTAGLHEQLTAGATS